MAKAIINEQNIHYELAGIKDFKLRTPALLLHGNGESMEIFSGLVQQLASSRGFVLMDSRYQGGSTPVYEDDEPRITYDLMADDAIQLMEDELGIAEYDVIGSSDGAITAILMALRSIRIRKLILIGVNADPSGIKPKMQRMIRRDLKSACRRNDLVTAELCRMMLEEPNIKNTDLASVFCETTVVYGKNDDAIKREHIAAIADAIPRSSFVEVKGAGHDLAETHPDALAELARSLL